MKPLYWWIPWNRSQDSLINRRSTTGDPFGQFRPAFRGIERLIMWWFFQFPLIAGKALFARFPTQVDAIKGHQLDQAFNYTLRLTQIIRQQREDNISTRFRVALGELRASQLSKESWELLRTRIANDLSLTEVTTFDFALRLYSPTQRWERWTLKSF